MEIIQFSCENPSILCSFWWWWYQVCTQVLKTCHTSILLLNYSLAPTFFWYQWIVWTRFVPRDTVENFEDYKGLFVVMYVKPSPHHDTLQCQVSLLMWQFLSNKNRVSHLPYSLICGTVWLLALLQNQNDHEKQKL